MAFFRKKWNNYKKKKKIKHGQVELPGAELSRRPFSGMSDHETDATELDYKILEIEYEASDLKNFFMRPYLDLALHDERFIFIKKLNDMLGQETHADPVMPLQVEDILSVQSDDSLMRLMESLERFKLGSEETGTVFKYQNLKDKVEAYQIKRDEEIQKKVDEFTPSNLATSANWYIANKIQEILQDKEKLSAFCDLLNIKKEDFPVRKDAYYGIEYDAHHNQFLLSVTQKEDEESNIKNKKNGFLIEKFQLKSEGVKALAVKGEILSTPQNNILNLGRKIDFEKDRKIDQLKQASHRNRSSF